jgi:hypothetical protein
MEPWTHGKYSTAMPRAIANGRNEWAPIKGWIEKYICGTQRLQQVVGNRADPRGGTVSQASFDKKEKVAHICPFVQESLALDNFWIEESPLADIPAIEAMITAQITPFLQALPAHDQLMTGPAPMPTGLKTFLTFFPNYMLAK